jgi:predicted AlkP superfamily phosphohydrolase/phosphomutase
LWQAKYSFRKFLPRQLKETAKRAFPRLADKVKAPTLPSLIDWNSTKAYSRETTPSIWINLRGRQPNGRVNEGREYNEVRNEIIEKLLKLADPETGEKVIGRVIKKEEVYTGKYLNDAPDLLIEWNQNKYIQRPSHSSQRDEPIQILNAKELKKAEMSTRPSGIHVPEGIFIIKGEGIKQGVELPPHRIYDIAPTILYLLDSPIPADMDGSVIDSAFKGEFLYKRANKTSQCEALRIKSESDIYSSTEQEEIRNRLEGLGYL